MNLPTGLIVERQADGRRARRERLSSGAYMSIREHRKTRSNKAMRPYAKAIGDQSGQPPFTTAIMLDVAEAPASRRRQSEAELLDVLVVRQVAGGTVHHDATVLEDVAVARGRQ